MRQFIDQHKHKHKHRGRADLSHLSGCPSSYYTAKSRPPPARSVSDDARTIEVERVHRTDYGARKVHAQLRWEGHQVGRCTVERLMRAAGLQGVQECVGDASAPELLEELVYSCG